MTSHTLLPACLSAAVAAAGEQQGVRQLRVGRRHPGVRADDAEEQEGVAHARDAAPGRARRPRRVEQSRHVRSQQHRAPTVQVRARARVTRDVSNNQRA